jgi:hypothetical protein
MIDYSNLNPCKQLIEFKNIILDLKIRNKQGNVHEKFTV